ncbi:MAG: hypothetical protein ACE5EO_09680 [Candidatus Krumholzibacteriia bacterium]
MTASARERSPARVTDVAIAGNAAEYDREKDELDYVGQRALSRESRTASEVF